MFATNYWSILSNILIVCYRYLLALVESIHQFDNAYDCLFPSTSINANLKKSSFAFGYRFLVEPPADGQLWGNVITSQNGSLLVTGLTGDLFYNRQENFPSPLFYHTMYYSAQSLLLGATQRFQHFTGKTNTNA